MLVDHGFNSSTVVSFLVFFCSTNGHEIVPISSIKKGPVASGINANSRGAINFSDTLPKPRHHLHRELSWRRFFFKKAMEKIDQGLFSSVFCNPHSLTFSTKENNTHVMKKSNRIGLQECMHDCSKKLQTSGVASQ